MSDPHRSGCEVDVLIVGGGPVGLSLAIELGWRGISCLIAFLSLVLWLPSVVME